MDIPENLDANAAYEVVGRFVLGRVRTPDEARRLLEALIMNLANVLDPEPLAECRQELEFVGEEVETLRTLVKNLKKVGKYIKNLL